jgi:hypothetical protein
MTVGAPPATAARRRRPFVPRQAPEQVEGDALGAAQILARYGMSPAATVSRRDKVFAIDVQGDKGDLVEVVYAFVFGDIIQRIGSSKSTFSSRMASFSKSVTRRWDGDENSDTPEGEAREWTRLLDVHGSGTVWARCGHVVQTPLGSINAYLAEENALLARWKPPQNRNLHR